MLPKNFHLKWTLQTIKILASLFLYILSETPLSSSKDGRDSYDEHLPLILLISLDEAWDNNFLNQFNFKGGSLYRETDYLDKFSTHESQKTQYNRVPNLEKLLNLNDRGSIIVKGIHVPSLKQNSALDHIFGFFDAQNQYLKFGDLLAYKLSPHFNLSHLQSTSTKNSTLHKTSAHSVDLEEWLTIENNELSMNIPKISSSPLVTSQYKEILGQIPSDKQSAQRWRLYKQQDRLAKYQEIHPMIQSTVNTLEKPTWSNDFLEKTRYVLSAMKSHHTIFASMEFRSSLETHRNDREKTEYLASNILQLIEDAKTLEINNRLYILVTAPFSKRWLKTSSNSEDLRTILWPETSLLLLTPDTSLKYSVDALNYQKLPKVNAEIPSNSPLLKGEGLVLDSKNTLSFPRIFSMIFKKLNAFDRETQGHLVEVKELKL